MRRDMAFVAGCALALASATPALDAEVTIYGTLLPFLDDVGTSDATAPGLAPDAGGASLVPAAAYTGVNLPRRRRLTSGTSNLGFRGHLQLNEHLRVFFQIENAVSPDGDLPNAWASRNSAVGLAGDWGTLFVGSWDTPYKYPLVFVGALRGLSPFDNTLTANPGFNVPGTITQGTRVNGKADAAFSRRQGNSVQYWTPSWEGLSARVAYSVNEGQTTASATAAATSPDLWSVLVSLDRGSYGLRYAFERHDDYFGLAQLGGSAGATTTNRSSQDDAHEVVGWLALPTGTKLSAIGERLSYASDDTADGAVRSYQREAIYVLLQQRFGDHQLWGSFGKAWDGRCEKVGGSACSTNGLAGRMWTVGYSYSLAKEADVFAAYYEMANDPSGSYAAFPSPGVVAPGATTRGVGVGILYTFSATWGGPRPAP